MATMMKLALAQVTPGMKLAKAVANAQGVTLMPAGIRLTPMFIARMQKWGLTELDVMVEEAPEAVQSEAEAAMQQLAASHAEASQEKRDFMRRIATEVAQRFTSVEDSPLMQQCRTMFVKKLIDHGPTGIVNRLRHGSLAAGERKK